MITETQLSQIPLIDTHVHRVHPNRSPELGNLGGGYIPGPKQEYHSRQTILYHMIMEELRKRYQMPESVSMEEVEKERQKRYGKDPQTYFRDLIQDQNVAMYCLEIGSPLGAPVYTQEEIQYFNASIPETKRCSIVRLERIQEAVMKQQENFDQFLDSFFRLLRQQIQEEQAIALKSCAAYVGGLAVEIVGREDARNAYEQIQRGESTPRAEKCLNNYLLLESSDIAAELDLPIQIHTGAGGGSYIDFHSLSPLNLVDFLKHEKIFNRVRIVLLHGGHPHEEDTSYLTAQFANVYTDFSGTSYLCSLKGVERMAALLERTPLNKVMYGSDGVMFPEFYWFSHKQFRKRLARLLNELIKEEYLTEKRALEAANGFMYQNALQCYTKLQDRVR